MVNISLPPQGRASGIGHVLAEMIAKMVAPNQMSGQISVGKTNDVLVPVEQQSNGSRQTFISLPTGKCAINQPLPK
jgi:hypothetical protein